MAKRLTPEQKAMLAELLEAADDDDEEEDAEAEEEAEPADEFMYQGKRYVYTPDDLEEIEESATPAKSAPPSKLPPAVRRRDPATSTTRKKATAPAVKRAKPADETVGSGADDPDPDSADAGGDTPRRRFLT